MTNKLIPVYKAEQEVILEDGTSLASLVQDHDRVEAYCELVPSSEISEASLDQLELVLGSKTDRLDLYPVNTIFVTTGMNLNDDCFDKAEVWAAKDTPKDKPINLEHKSRNIVGHMTDSWGVDASYNILDSNLAVDNLPDKFHLLTGAVVYKHLKSKDVELTKEIAKLISEISRGEWCVSMECLFSNFDYGLQKATGALEIIQRNEKTAFLTKYLRIYKGVGVYNNDRIYRVLRNITFSGKAFTRKPANPESVVINNFILDRQIKLNNSGANIMVEDKKENKEQNAEIATLKSQIAELNTKLTEADTKLTEFAGQASVITEKDKVIADKDTAIVEKDAKITEATAAIENLNKELAETNRIHHDYIDELTAKLTAAETKLATAETELNTIKAEAIKLARIQALVDAGNDKAKAEEIFADFGGLNDEQFNKIVSLAKCAKPDEKKAKADEAEAKKGADKAKEDEKMGKEECSETKAKEVLDGEKEKEAALNVEESKAEDLQKARQHLSKVLGSMLK